MQFVDDDMDDELYRRAAEDYPLNTDSGDWNKLQEKMRSATGENSNKKGKRRGAILLLALIPLLVICTTYINNDLVVGKVGELNKNSISNETISEDRETEIPSTNTEKEFDKSVVDYRSIVHDEAKKEVIESQAPGLLRKSEMAQSRNKFRKNSEVREFEKTNKHSIIGADKKYSNKESDTKIGEADKKETNQSQTELVDKNVPVNQDIISNTPKPSIENNDKVVKKDSVETPPVAASVKEKKEKKKQPRFYLGVQAGPDFSMVKSTNINKAGYSVGLMAGYTISRKFAIETGILWDQKRYSSEGQYFKTEKLNWPHVTILDLSGYCNMFEIPVNLRYNVVSNGKTTWFVNAGLSSYLMKKENYDYHYKRYGVYGYGNREYKNTTNNWLSVANLSVGIQKKLGTIGDLRIEPYVKLPLNGVGIGSMPLSSTGIYFGITRPIR